MALACAVNDSHSAAADLIENLIIAQSPICVPNVDFIEGGFQRVVFVVASLSAQSAIEEAIQAKTASDP
jgi:hypothetical protein